MTDESPHDLLDALDCAVVAAEAGCQASAGIWRQLTTEQQETWLARSARSVPPFAVFLKTILPAAQKMADDDNAARPGFP